MTSLDSYLRGPYKEDGAFLKKLFDTIKETIPIFYKQKLDLPVSKDDSAPRGLTWPYAVSAGPNKVAMRAGGSLSASTHCMVLFALDAFSPRGKDDFSLLLGKGFRPCKLPASAVKIDELRKETVAAKKALITLLGVKQSKRIIVKSTTYGANDPFTLTWLAEISFRLQKEELEELLL